MGIRATVRQRGGVLGKIILLVSVFTLLCAVAANAYLFLKFDDIQGDSQDAKHKGEIDISTVDWGISMTGSMGGGSSKPEFSDLQWTQVQDSSFPVLFDYAATGKHINKALIDFVSPGQNSYRYFQMLFDDVRITSLNLHGTSDSKPTVEGAFDYAKITMNYWTQRPDGSIGSQVSASYDLAKNIGNAGALAGLFGLGLSGPFVSNIPIPASLLLLGSGLAGLITLKRKFRR